VSRRLLVFCIFMLSLQSPGAQAQYAEALRLWSSGGLCTADPLAAEVTLDTGEPTDEAPIEFIADEAEGSPSEAVLTGDVIVERGAQRLKAPRITLDRETNIATAQGEAIYGSPDLAARGREAEFNLDTSVIRFADAEYYLPGKSAQGDAERGVTNPRTGLSRFHGFTYSTCERDREVWEVRSRRLDLDQNRGRGVTRDATLALGGVPILYFPYLSFPIDDERHTGFLTPRFGQDSRNGFDLQVPFYWNIAPNRDLTITPRILSKRGVMFGAEYRFLNLQDNGIIRFEYMPSDQKSGSDRGSAFVRHNANPAPRTFTELLFQYVSDDDYLNDFDNRLNLLSETTLERRLDSVYYGDNWNALARVQSFQTIDPIVFGDNEPYNRLPQFLFDGDWVHEATGLNYEMRGELVNFDRDNGVVGTRLDLRPGLSWPLRGPSGFIVPKLRWRSTFYRLRDNDSDFEDSPERSAPIASLDGGLFFERPTDLRWWWDEAGLLTLEPRLFYLYVPNRNQSDLPRFDSFDVDQSFPWLFLDNRFTGADRLGDADQLTVALTSRLLRAADGIERLRLSVGQIRYFRDREVTLFDTDEPERSNHSDLIGETVLKLTPSWSLRGGLQWDTSDNTIQRGSADIFYRPGNGRLANLSYRFAEDQIEQVDFSVFWPFSERWQTMARWNYSLRENQNVDTFAGFQYSDCCWAIRLLARHNRRDPDENAKNAIFFELELKGLAGIGDSIDSLLRDAIFDYH